jgi:L-idonate 5-dehydrogenase
MRYYGSAMRTPHVQGAFRQEIVINRSQAHVVSDALSDAEAAMAEPLSVALHAVRRAGPLLGKRVLVTGCGPIGGLIVAAARRAGAAHIVATDVNELPLESARAVGADQTFNILQTPDALLPFAAGKGTFDVLFEASGNASALRGAFDAIRPRGIIVQVGLGGDVPLPMNVIVAKEFDLRGAFRFHEEFAVAVELLNKQLIDTKPLISDVFSYRDSLKAFATANDRSKAMKVIVDFA